MKSLLSYALYAVAFVAYARAGCDENIINTMNDCVRIRTDARDSFCVTKQDEIAKCNCVYDTFIKSCYDYCPDESSIQTAKKTLEADMDAQCSAANLDPDNIPANVYNEVAQETKDEFVTPTNNDATTNDSTNNNANTNTNNQSTNTNTSQNTLTNEDYKDGAGTIKACAALLIANAVLASLLL